jgi:exopolysaccharide biosynthesis protein
MKKNLRRILSLALALLLAAGPVTAAASEALGDDLTSQTTTLHQNTQLATNVFWSNSYSDLRTENLITYSPGSAVTPIVTYGSVLTSCNTVSSMAKTLEQQGYRVVAGMNGDFYNTSTGLPIGLVITDGEIKSSDGGYYAIGFRSNGTAVLGKPGLTVTADLGYAVTDESGYQTQVVRKIAGINKARVSTGGIYLYTHDFNAKHTTGNTESGVDVVCSIVSGKLAIGQTLTLQVDSVIEASSATSVPEGKIVLSANNLSNSYYTDALRKMTPGSSFTISVTASSSEWNDVSYAIGALYSLVENGSVVSGLPSGSNPRTAVGQKADGTLVFYTIDGRQSGYSIGATMTQVASRLIELGCVRALCLDGGGSTTLTVTEPDSTSAQRVNKPSEGSERSVSNHIFLVASNTSSGVLDHFYVSASDSYVLAGSKTTVSVSGVDTNYIPMTATCQLKSSGGTLTENSSGQYTLTTPTAGGDVTITASGSGKTGSTVVHAVSTPDSITVKNGSTTVTSVTLTPGSKLNLSASAMYNHQALKSEDTAFTWTLSGGIGSVSNDGTITATTPGSGTLTVSAGGKSTTVKVTVSKVALSTLEDFEDGAPALASYSYGGTLTTTSASDKVQRGRQAGQVSYTLGADGTASVIFEKPYTLGSAYTQLNFWLRGDGSENTLSVLTSDGSTTTATLAASLFETGNQLLNVTLPAGATSIVGFRITGTGKTSTDAEGNPITVYPDASGTFYLDQLVGSYGGTADQTVPNVSVSLSGTALSATISDGVDGILPKSAISVTYDGSAISFSYDASSGKLTATLPESDGKAHRVSVFAKDASGNIGRASKDIAVGADWTPAFSDTKDHWASTYIDYLYTSGVTTGYSDGTFRPNQNITRQQFAAMLFRHLGLDESRYENVKLPFADADQISGYALTAVKALYSIGVINGTSVNGKLYFYPGNNLTRAQASAMIGRTQEKGYATVELSFTDAGSIPSYAKPYIQTMVAQGILGGYGDGSFKPNANITRGQMAKILYNIL